MREMPTIADALYRNSLKDHRLLAFRDIVTTKKFVLEHDVYEFLHSVMWGRVTDHPDVFINLLKMARLPFSKIWVEPAARKEVGFGSSVETSIMML